MRTLLSDDETAGLGSIELVHPEGSFEPTPASRIGLLAVGRHRDLLSGIGIDWGCGVGVLAIAAAQVPTVERVIGLDIEPLNTTQAAHNAALNAAADRAVFYVADSMAPMAPEGVAALEQVTGSVQFVLANPPASAGDDGFGFRRRVMEDVAPFLANGSVVLLNVSAQYGMTRIRALEEYGFYYEAVLESTEPVPFDQSRSDLAENLADYVAEEARGGVGYEFLMPDGVITSASEAASRYEATGESPLSRWQVHLFRKDS